MSSFHYEGKKIYYEEIGNGKPLLLTFSDVDNQKDAKNGLWTFGMNGQGRRLPFANIKDLKKWM